MTVLVVCKDRGDERRFSNEEDAMEFLETVISSGARDVDILLLDN